jgi:hypothetical protein
VNQIETSAHCAVARMMMERRVRVRAPPVRQDGERFGARNALRLGRFFEAESIVAIRSIPLSRH